MRFELTILSVIWIVCAPNVAGQTHSCLGLDKLITNFNDGELSRCVKFGSCAGVYCVNVIRQLRHIVEIFNFTLLPCAQPTPALLVQLLGQQDPIHNNTRKEVYHQELINNASIPISSGGIVLSIYNVSINVNLSAGSIGIEIERSLTKVLNYTVVNFDFDHCPSTTTSASSVVVTNTTFTPTDPLSINTVGPTSADIVGAIIGVSVSLSTIVVIIAIILCAIFLGYMYIHKESRIGHFVKKFIRQPTEEVVKEYRSQDSIVAIDEDDSAAHISFTNPIYCDGHNGYFED